MSPSTASLTSAPLAKGVYSPSSASDSRSPCPLVNCLANHGYIPRDGREVRINELKAALGGVGISSALTAVFSNPIFLERKDLKAPSKPRSFFSHLWYLIRNPWAVLFSSFAMRTPGQKDSMGKKCLNLEQLALPGAVEHDVSLSRYDDTEGDNQSPQPELIRELLSFSSDGEKLTAEDLAAFRRWRIAMQKENNPELNYGPFQHQVACGEIALILNLFGDGNEVPCKYVRAFFQDERLPFQEGWKTRRWWSLGLWELGRAAARVKGIIGIQV